MIRINDTTFTKEQYESFRALLLPYMDAGCCEDCEVCDQVSFCREMIKLVSYCDTRIRLYEKEYD